MYPCRDAAASPCARVNTARGLNLAPRPFLSWADTIFQTPAFSGLKVAFGPCRPNPPSYMRLTVAISRVFERWGFGQVRRQGPANLPQKEGYEDHGKGHWDRSRHHEFVRRRNGWQDGQSHRKRRGHADDPVDRRL